MKKLLLAILLACTLSISFAAFTPTSSDKSKTEQTNKTSSLDLKNLTHDQQRVLMQQFTKMSVKDYEAVTGKKMNVFSKLGLKITQQRMKRELKKDNGSTSDHTLLLVILAILLPPLAVYLHENAFNGKFWLSLLLTLLFFLPGVIYALIVVLS